MFILLGLWDWLTESWRDRRDNSEPTHYNR